MLGALCILLLQLPAYADGESEFLVFLSADHLERRAVSQPTIETSDFTPTVDVLFSYTNGPWRVLSEYFLTDDESELERLQIGYDYSADSTIWFGRFHQPISAWNHRYHHGAYLQPSISRPAIENWEDDGGIIPAHVTGLMLDSWQTLGDKSAIRYVAAVGIAPELVDDEIAPFDLLDPNDSARLPAASLNISYYPDHVAETSVGLIAGYAEIESAPNSALGISTSFEIRQSLLGAQINWESDNWQLVSALYYIDNEVERSVADAGGWFVAGYVQALRTLSANTNAYLRLENSDNAGSANYLQIFPNFVMQREMIGFRYDFAARQALAIEISSNRVSTDKFSEFRVQWSAAFP